MSDVLRVGDRSPRVAEVRATLARLGLLPSFDGYVIDKEAQQFEEKDTFFDAALAEALQGFQQSRGFVPNGEKVCSGSQPPWAAFKNLLNPIKNESKNHLSHQ